MYPRRCMFVVLLGIGICTSGAWGRTLRIVSYNIDCADQSSDNNITGSTHSLPTVIQAVGLHHIGTNAQPVDIIGAEELNSTTLSNWVVQLNNIYGAGTYAFDPTPDGSQGSGLIYKTNTVQVVSARALPTGSTVLLQSNGAYTTAHSTCGGGTVPRGPIAYRLRPVGFGSSADFYMYVSHARSTSDNSCGDARYAEAQEVRSDAKYNLPAGAHILYSGDWNLFNGSYENAYKCLTGQTTSDGINWSDTSAIWANTNQTQAYDPISKTSPPTTLTWTNAAVDNATFFYTETTQAGTFAMSSRIDIQLPNALMFAAYNNQGGMQIAPDTADPYDTSNFPSAKYPYAFETFGNNGSTPRGSTTKSSANNSLNDLSSTVPNATTVYADIQLTGSGSSFTGSDHYPIVGDYNVVTTGPAASFTGSPTSGAAPLGVTFTDTSTGTITNRSWSFGDGGTSNLAAASVFYTYSTAGVYTVQEIVSGPGGSDTNTQVNYITVWTPFQAWQVQYFGSTTNPAAAANADPLGKGMSNFNQFLTGINPTNPASVFRIASVVQQGSDVLVTWTTAGGYTNVVQATAGLPDGSYATNFQDLSGLVIISGSGDATTNYLDAGGATNMPARYYRVRLQP